jgi:hypothetical protein
MGDDAAVTGSPWGSMMKAFPRWNAAAAVTESAQGTVIVKVKCRRPEFMKPPLSWIVPFKQEKSTELDRLGTEIWRMCDGSHRVDAIVDAFAASHRLTFHEARVAVSGHLKSLIQRGVLAIELPENSAAGMIHGKCCQNRDPSTSPGMTRSGQANLPGNCHAEPVEASRQRSFCASGGTPTV